MSVAGLSLPHAAWAAGVLPQGGRYVAGAGTIASQGGALTVTQPGSARGVIDWTSFSIGHGNTVMFNNGSGATLNRVTGGASSALSGALNATGSLYLINPQGIVVGRSGVISTGGRFVASTLNLTDAAFIEGGTLTLAGLSNGKVVNLGKISSSGGDVFLVAGNAVVNAGSVSAPNGTAEYVAARQAVLYQSSTGRQVYVQIGSRGAVVDHGITQAAQINLEAADGNIYALAGSGSRIRATGTALRDGHIWLVAGNGHVTQEGTLVATNSDRTGGTVDTIANALTLRSDATVQAGRWNVSTPNFTIDSATAGAFVRSLNARTSVDAVATGVNGAAGNMNVESSLDWQGPAALSLVAFRNITIAPTTTISNTGSGILNLKADAANIDIAGSVSNLGIVDWSRSTGIVSLMHDMNGSYHPGTLVGNASWTAPVYSGLVTQLTGYELVNSVSDLRRVALNPVGNFALGTNLDASSGGAKIGSAQLPFRGQFDGMGHTVSHVGYGLFGVVGASGVVRNICIVDGAYLGYGLVGLLADTNSGTIAHAYSTGTISSDAGTEGVGGLVGTNNGIVERSWSSARILGDAYLGGLVGYNSSGATVRQSYATGSVEGYGHGGPGGLVGVNEGLISASYATGNISASSSCGACGGDFAGGGGLVYYQTDTGRIEQSFSTGLISQYYGVPSAVVGTNLGTIAANVYYDKETSKASQVGLGANGLTTSQMSIPQSFDASWDFSSSGTWSIPAGATHPVLQWQLQPL